MATQCPKCNRKLDFTYIKKVVAEGHLKCPSCKAGLEESKMTKIMSLLLAIVPIIFIAYFIKNFILRVIIIFVWAFFVNLGIRPAIAKFNLVKK